MKMKITQVLFLPWFRERYSTADRAGTSLAFGALILYGTYNAFAKTLTVYLSPISLLLLSEALTALFVVITIGLLPLTQILFKSTGKHILVAIAIGILSSGIAPLLWFNGLTQTSAANASILAGSTVIFSLFFDWLLMRERANALQITGATVVFLGIATVSLGSDASIAAHIGDLYIIAKGVFFGLGTALFKKYLTGMNPEAALFLRSITGIVFALAISAFLAHPFAAEISSFPIEQITMLLAFVFFSRFLHLTFFYGALDRTSANKVALISHATPLSGMFFAVLIVGEHLTGFHFIGGMLIIVGLIIEQLSAERVSRVLSRIMRSHPHDQARV